MTFIGTSSNYGRGSLGLQASATDQITEINLTHTASFSKYSDVEDTGLGMLLRSATNGRLTNNSAPVGGTGQRVLRGGVSSVTGATSRVKASASSTSPSMCRRIQRFRCFGVFGEDDFWDVALNYEGEFGGFKVAAGIGYGEITDNLQTNTVCNASSGRPPGHQLPAVPWIDERDPREIGPDSSTSAPVRRPTSLSSRPRASRAPALTTASSSGRRRPVSRRSFTISARPPFMANTTTTTAAVTASAR